MAERSFIPRMDGIKNLKPYWARGRPRRPRLPRKVTKQGLDSGYTVSVASSRADTMCDAGVSVIIRSTYAVLAALLGWWVANSGGFGV